MEGSVYFSFKKSPGSRATPISWARMPMAATPSISSARPLKLSCQSSHQKLTADGSVAADTANAPPSGFSDIAGISEIPDTSADGACSAGQGGRGLSFHPVQGKIPDEPGGHGLPLVLGHRHADVFHHRHVGEQGVLLEQVSHPALLGRQVDPRLGVVEHPAVQHDAFPVRLLDAGDALQGQAFAAAAFPQDGEDLVLHVEGGFQGEARIAFFYRHCQTHRLTPFPSAFVWR